MKNWRLFALGWLLVVAGGTLAHLVQTSGGINIEDVRFEFDDGKKLSALIFRPPNAGVATPAPGILAVHGYINSRETQSGFSIEFARRGYVVLAIDQTGHGFSEGAAFSAGFGGPAALRYLRSLPYVEVDNIGLTGHSMGGWTGLAAASDSPDGYRSIALVGSSTGPGFAPEGSPQFPKNLGVIFSRYDEFSELMWGVNKAADIASSSKLKAVFGSTSDVVPRKVYGDVAAGTARWLATPATTHPGDHISTEAIADTLDWMGVTLTGQDPLPVTEQIWYWKEFGTLVALIGGVLLLLGSIDVLIALPAFTRLASPGQGAAQRMDRRWWTGLAVASLVPAVTFYPLTRWGTLFAPNTVFPQGITNRILVWALANGLIALGMLLIQRRMGIGEQSAKQGQASFLLTAAVAALSVACLYLAVAASDWLFKTDFRFWVVALKPMAAHHLASFAAYLLPFTLFFYVTQRAWFENYSLRSSAAAQYVSTVAASVAAFFIMVAFSYVYLFARGQLPGADALFTIIAIQFIPVLAATAAISVFAWRRTGDVTAGAMVCGLLVTWYVVAGQATHV